MKTIYKNIVLAALALGAVACSQEDDFSLSYLNDPDAVRITAQVGSNDVTGGFTRSNPLGDATAQTEFNIGDQISVVEGTQAAVIYQLGTDGWSPVGDSYLKWQGATYMNVTAYYPVGKHNASADFFTVPTEYTAESPITDADYMMYGNTVYKGEDKAINLTMNRKMARIVVDDITFNNQFATGYSVTAIKVHANTKGYAYGRPEAGNIVVSAYQQDDAFYALLAPTTEDSEATFLTVTMSDGTNSQDLTVKGIPATVAGNSYNLALTVGKDVASIKGLVVNDWSDGGVIGETENETEEVSYLYDEETATYYVYLEGGVSKAIEEAGTTPSTIKMMADIEFVNLYANPRFYGGNQNIILDLNGHTLSRSGEVVYNAGTLTIKNGTLKTIGTPGDGTDCIYNCTKLTIENDVTIETTGEMGIKNISGNCIINGGIINAGTNYAVYCIDEGSVSIKGGTFTGQLYTDSNSTITIEGGTFSVDPTEWVDTENYTVTKNEAAGTWSVTAKATE